MDKVGRSKRIAFCNDRNMVRIYCLIVCLGRAKYDTVSYYLDPAEAASAAIRLSKAISPDSYYLVQQLDVYPSSFQRNELLRVDGTA